MVPNEKIIEHGEIYKCDMNGKFVHIEATNDPNFVRFGWYDESDVWQTERMWVHVFRRAFTFDRVGHSDELKTSIRLVAE